MSKHPAWGLAYSKCSVRTSCYLKMINRYISSFYKANHILSYSLFYRGREGWRGRWKNLMSIAANTYSDPAIIQRPYHTPYPFCPKALHTSIRAHLQYTLPHGFHLTRVLVSGKIRKLCGPVGDLSAYIKGLLCACESVGAW